MRTSGNQYFIFRVPDCVTHIGPLSLLCPADYSSGGTYDKRDVFRGQHALLRQRQRSPSDLNPRYQRQHSDPPKAAVLPAADPPGPGRVDIAPRPGPEHCPGYAGTVKQPTLNQHILYITVCSTVLLRVAYWEISTCLYV